MASFIASRSSGLAPTSVPTPLFASSRTRRLTVPSESMQYSVRVRVSKPSALAPKIGCPLEYVSATSPMLLPLVRLGVTSRWLIRSVP